MSQILLCQGSAQRLPLADQSVHCCVTSPPYLGLRCYEGLAPEPWLGGGYVPVPGVPMIEVPAWEGCLGNEETVPLYILHTLLWLRECRRVLRDDGCLWLNIGDSYANTPGNGRGGERVGGGIPHRSATAKGGHGYPQGTLLGIPQQVMLAAVADGWICRNDLVWQKVSPMPESARGWRYEQPACACVQPNPRRAGAHTPMGASSAVNYGIHYGDAFTLSDPACPHCQGTGRAGAPVLRRGSWRHTRSHEYIFMLCKQMGYFANGEVVREANEWTGRRGTGRKHVQGDGMSKPNGWAQGQVVGRNPRSVLTPAPSALNLDHYAAFPPSLIEPLITATCPAQCCAVCGVGYAPTIRDTGQPAVSANGSRFDVGKSAHHGHVQAGERTQKVSEGALRQACECLTALQPVPGVCLDPFAGASTTLLVARALGRHAIGVEASPTYVQLSRERLGLTALEAWEHGAPAVPVTFTDLPLFAREE